MAKACQKLAGMDVIALRDWHDGIYLNESDARLLVLAWEERITLVTYDLNTFPLTVKERLEAGLSHAGMIYVSSRFRQNDVGAIARCLVELWRREKNDDWVNRIRFLD